MTGEMKDPTFREVTLDVAREVIARGGSVAFSTDTVWGLGVHPQDEGAVGRIYQQKGRPSEKALQVLCEDVTAAARFVRLPPELQEDWRRLTTVLWPGALTLVVPAGATCPPWLVRDGKVGLRVPSSPLTLELLRACGGALAATSLNRSGEPPVHTFAQALELGIADAVLPGPDAGQVASTVYDLTARRVLRAGALSAERIAEVVS